MTNLNIPQQLVGSDVDLVALIPQQLSKERQSAAALTANVKASIARLLDGLAGCPQLAKLAGDGLAVIAAAAPVPASRASAPKPANNAEEAKANKRRRTGRRTGLRMD